MSNKHNNASRREFLRRAAVLASTGVAAPWALNLASVSAASAQSVGDGYRALVCIFLYGGNDNHNTVAPLDPASHAQYMAVRGQAGAGIALDIPELTATELRPDNAWTDGRQMALHPKLTDLKDLFNEKRLAVGLNLGPLMKTGTTREDFDLGRNLPPKLFSHNDQQSVWQSGGAEGFTSGWGGRIGDLLMSQNGGGAGFTCISASGNAVYLSGRDIVQYQVSANGPVSVVSPVFGSSSAAAALREVMQQPGGGSHFESEHAALATHAIGSQQAVSDALPKELDLCLIEGNGLSAQLNIVARLIAGRKTLANKRQVFFVSLGGFDTHDTLLLRHDALMGTLGPAMAKFYRATESLGVASQVTTFTASDFGRTLTSNGDGSDHGWGSHHLVMGGSVKGKSWFGQLPVFDSNTPGGIRTDQQVGNGRLLPFNAVDEYGATLAKWMGVSSGDMRTVFPNIGSFNTPDLGFLGA